MSVAQRGGGTVEPGTNRPGTLVVVAAHADDAELNAGGLMAKWVAHGGDVAIVMLTNNHSGEIIPAEGDPTRLIRLRPEQTTRLRHAEQDRAAALLGAPVHYLGYPQRHFWDGSRVVSLDFAYPQPNAPQALPPLVIAFRQAAHVRRLADLLQRLNPSLVLTQTPLDLDPEHHASACMVFQAMQFLRADGGTARNVPLRLWTPGSSCVGGLLDPGYEHVEDVTPFFEMKLKLCACHASQMTAQRWAMVTDRARAWGERIGVLYAEPFKDVPLGGDGGGA